MVYAAMRPRCAPLCGCDRNGAIAALGNAMSVTSPAQFATWTATGIMANRVYCTYFDHNYLPRGLALYHSLQRHAPGARALGALPERGLPSGPAGARSAKPGGGAAGGFRSRRSRRRGDPVHRAARSNITSRVRRPGCCSCSNSKPDAEWVTYLDSDLFFFASPDPIYDEMKDAAFGIIPHRFSRGSGRPAQVRALQCRLGERSQA